MAAIKAKNAEKRRRLDAKGFQKFLSLPMELQVMIWKEFIKNESMDFDNEYSCIDYDKTTVNIPPWVYACPATGRRPVALSTCRLSRLLALHAWIKQLDCWLDDRPTMISSYGMSGEWVFEKWKVLLVEYVKAMEEGRAPVKLYNEYWSWDLKPAPLKPSKWSILGSPRGGYG